MDQILKTQKEEILANTQTIEAKSKEIHEKRGIIQEQLTTITKLHAEIVNMNRDSHILNQKVEQQKGEILLQAKQLKNQNDVIFSKESTVESKCDEIDNLTQQIQTKDSIAVDNENRIKTLHHKTNEDRETIEEFKHKMQHYENDILEKEKVIDDLLQTNDALTLRIEELMADDDAQTVAQGMLDIIAEATDEESSEKGTDDDPDEKQEPDDDVVDDTANDADEDEKHDDAN